MKKKDYLTEEQIAHFWSKVNKEPGQGPNGECWEWMAGRKNEEGYGGFYLKQIKNSMNCHKIAFMIVHHFAIGEIPKDIVIRHLCNNPACCNPDHLAIGTFKDNSQDMVAAGNSQKGTKCRNAKLDDCKVAEIRRLWTDGYRTKAELARMFDVNSSTIISIIENRTWKDTNYVPVTHPGLSGRYCKFSDEVVREIKKAKASGESLRSIRKRFGICQTQIYNITSGQQRKGV